MNRERATNVAPEVSPIPKRTGTRLFVSGFLASLFTLLLFPCLCGHLGREALLTSTLGMLLTWLPFTRYKRTGIDEQCIAVFYVVASTFIFIKNVADVLWFGHEPIL